MSMRKRKLRCRNSIERKTSYTKGAPVGVWQRSFLGVVILPVLSLHHFIFILCERIDVSVGLCLPFSPKRNIVLRLPLYRLPPHLSLGRDMTLESFPRPRGI